MSDIQAKLLEDRQQRAIRARRRFKGIVRQVINHMIWLIEDEHVDFTLNNVRRNVTMLTRRKKMSKTITIKEKSMLRKAAEYRTEEEKRHLHKCIGDLTCFRRYPAEVKQDLVSVTYFEFYDSGRVLMKQHHPAYAMYFLLSGEVTITHTIFDEVENKWVTIALGKKKAGSIFGEVSLLNNVPRTATVTTCTPCELLCLKKEDFDYVLKDTLKKQWDEIIEAMSIFPYFDYLEDSARRECCVISKIKEFQPNQTILGDGYGVSKSKMVYFVIEGKCSVIHALRVTESIKSGIKCYELYNPQKPKLSKNSTDETTENVDSNINLEDNPQRKIIERRCSKNTDEVKLNPSEEKEGKKQITLSLSIDANTNEIENQKSILKKNQSSTSKITITSEDINMNKQRNSKGFLTSKSSTHSIRVSKSDISSIDSNELREPKISFDFDEEENFRRKPSRSLSFKRKLTDDRRRTFCSDVTAPPEVKTHFIQVAVLSERANFKDSHRLRNRRIVALSKVKCLIIPSYWLELHSRANIWNRIDQYLNLRMPTATMIYDLFIKQKKWMDYRRSITEDILSKHKFPNNTTIHDVPYSIRIKEPFDFGAP